MTFESGIVQEDLRTAVMWKVRRDGMNGKMYGGLLVDRVCRVTNGLIDDE